MESKAEAVVDLQPIRRDFPALSRIHRGRPVAFFDGPGGTQVPRRVVDAMNDYLFHHNANTHWRYPTSAETDAALLEARRTFADFLNADPSEVAFGANMTSLTYHLGRALGRDWGPGDEIVVTELDHHANVDPWRALARERGVTVRVARMRPEVGDLDEGHLYSLIGPSTRLVAIGAASNALGTINDVKRVAARSHAVGALAFVDAVHYAAHELPDVRAFDCDFLACSAYKFYGPHVGVLYGRRALIEKLDVAKLAPAPEEAPERLETGTQNHEGIVGAAAAVDYVASLAGTTGPRRERLAVALEVLRERSEALFARLWQGLEAVPGVTLFGRHPGAGPRTPTLAFSVAGRGADDVAADLADRGLFLSSGDFYAATAVARLGHAHDGVVRAGLACYTSEEDVERLIEGVAAATTGS